MAPDGRPVVPPDVPPEDGGRQFERTAFAHLRTALAAVVTGLLIVRQADDGAERYVVGALALAGVVAIVAAGSRREAELGRRSSGAPARQVAAIVAALGLLQGLAVVVVL